MTGLENIRVLFVAGFGPIVRDAAASRGLYVGSLQIPFKELEARGHRMLVKNRKEPWGQTVRRFLGPEGLLVGITFTPMLRQAH